MPTARHHYRWLPGATPDWQQPVVLHLFINSSHKRCEPRNRTWHNRLFANVVLLAEHTPDNDRIAPGALAESC
ncbi:hypothetical protein ABC733_05600 [Mangrovibacter sp. SLW1]